MNDRYDTYRLTKVIVRRLFCLLKFKCQSTRKLIIMKVVIMLSHNVEEEGQPEPA